MIKKYLSNNLKKEYNQKLYLKVSAMTFCCNPNSKPIKLAAIFKPVLTKEMSMNKTTRNVIDNLVTKLKTCFCGRRVLLEDLTGLLNLSLS